MENKRAAYELIIKGDFRGGKGTALMTTCYYSLENQTPMASLKAIVFNG